MAFLKLSEKIYAPFTAGLLKPFRGDRALAEENRCELDRVYQRVCDDRRRSYEQPASESQREPRNENKTLVTACITGN